MGLITALKDLFFLFLIQRSPYFDQRYYLHHNPDVQQAGVNPLKHYYRWGWKEGRNPSPLFDTNYYLTQNKDVRDAGAHPLVHYLRYGILEHRPCLPSPIDPPQAAAIHPLDLRAGEPPLLPAEFFRSHGQIASPPTKAHEIAVILHVFYPEIFSEIAAYLSNLEGEFDLYVSLPDTLAPATALAEHIFAAFPHAQITIAENRGRDILPFIRILKAIQPLDYSCLLKLHTKQSPHRDDGQLWRKEVYDQLIGSKAVVSQVIDRLLTDRQAGILGPKGHVLNNQLYIGGNAANLSGLADRAGIQHWQNDPFYFVAGTMFWAKPAVFQWIDRVDLKISDFEPEPIDADGAMVHSVERFLGLAALKLGFKLLEVDQHGHITEPSPDFIYQYAPIPQVPLLSHRSQQPFCRKSVTFFSAYQEEYAIEYLRITAPLRQAGIEIIPGVHAGEVKPDMVLQGDAVIFQREFPQNIAAYDQIINLAKHAGKPVIYELDDLLFSLPEQHPERLAAAYTSSLLPMLTAVVEADLVTVPTRHLQAFLRPFNPHVAILPNYLDDSLWSLKPPVLRENKEKPLVIGYMGSSSHLPDLEIIAPVLIELLSRYPGQLEVWIWGTRPPDSLRALPQVKWVPSPSNNYKEFVRYFQTQSADIFVAPLVDNSFNRCKSPLKFFEYSALGVAGVYSKVAPYQSVITHGHDGLLAASPQEWLDHLLKLVEDDEYRFELAKNAQNTVNAKWLLSKNTQQWTEIFDHLPELVTSRPETKSKLAEIIRSITHQQQGAHLKHQKEINELTHQLQRTVAELSLLNAEIRDIDRRKYLNFSTRLQRVSSIFRPLNRLMSYHKNQVPGRAADWKIKIKRRLLLPRDTRLILQSGLFDETWYREKYPDVSAAHQPAVRHYLLFGGFEGRDPSPHFSSSWYLGTYPDVRSAGVNPLLHYIRFGKAESRMPRATLDVRQPPVEFPATTPEKILQSSDLVPLIQHALKFDRYVLSISHNNYLTETTGGVQVYIARQQKSLFSQGVSYLHLFPNKFNLYLLEQHSQFLIGINIDGVYLGVSEVDQVLAALRQLDGLALESFHIHHLMGFNIHAVEQILEFSNRQAEFWLHDFFSLCPSYHLLRNDVEYCGAPSLDSNACGICKYGLLRKQQLPTLQNLFAKYDLTVIAPSNFSLNLWQTKFPYQGSNSKVVPLLTIRWTEPIQVNPSRDHLSIGYIGFPLEQKGWKTWMDLTDTLRADDRYRFYHFSSVKGTPGNYKRIHVAVTPAKPTLMIDNLIKENIDVAFLWSVVPETFSFTLHESLAAGCFIVTNKKSGNIQDFLHQHPQHGIVLDHENDLLDLLSGDGLISLVQEYQRNGKPTGALVHDSPQE